MTNNIGVSERRIAVALAAACLLAAIVGAPLARDAWRSETLITAMRSGDASSRGEMLDRFADFPPATLPDRAVAALAQIALTTAADAPEGGLRQLSLSRAHELVGHLRVTRGAWAPSLILSTEMTIAESPPGAPVAASALSDYAASYHVAPFLRQEARWRILLGAEVWPKLDRATRQHVIDEAVWLTRSDNAQRERIEADMGDSAAGVAYQLALAQAAPP